MLNNTSVLRGSKVLVVDDNADTCELIAIALELHAIDVVAVDSVQKAVAVFPTVKPDLVISDIAMPSEDGYTLIQQIRSFPPEQGGTVPAIALTAYTSKSERQRVLAAGFQQHISKPVEPEKLIMAIVEILSFQPSKSLLSTSI